MSGAVRSPTCRTEDQIRREDSRFLREMAAADAAARLGETKLLARLLATELARVMAPMLGIKLR